jgi:hypothetical protein
MASDLKTTLFNAFSQHSFENSLNTLVSNFHAAIRALKEPYLPINFTIFSTFVHFMGVFITFWRCPNSERTCPNMR